MAVQEGGTRAERSTAGKGAHPSRQDIDTSYRHIVSRTCGASSGRARPHMPTCPLPWSASPPAGAHGRLPRGHHLSSCQGRPASRLCRQPELPTRPRPGPDWASCELIRTPSSDGVGIPYILVSHHNYSTSRRSYTHYPRMASREGRRPHSTLCFHVIQRSRRSTASFRADGPSAPLPLSGCFGADLGAFPPAFDLILGSV